MKIESINVFNIVGAIYGMRNPLESHHKSDSGFDFSGNTVVGHNDMKLAKKLIKAGSSHRKFTRQIFISMDITANSKWWAEFDTYEHTVTNSTSQMHTLLSKPFDLDDFSNKITGKDSKKAMEDLVIHLNTKRINYLLTKDKAIWRDILELLPQSYLYTRHTTMSYEVFITQYFLRKSHKMDEWIDYCKILRKELPYMDEFLKAKEE